MRHTAVPTHTKVYNKFKRNVGQTAIETHKGFGTYQKEAWVKLLYLYIQEFVNIKKNLGQTDLQTHS
jgi:hypothetical protein